MKLLRLKLKNFISVYVTMNRKEIDIDFTKCKNNIILLVGANGSGKTSLLSNMQPFPSLGTLDLRNSQDLILEGEDGYKLLSIRIPSELYEQLDQIAKEANTSRNEIAYRMFISSRFRLKISY